MVFGHKFTEIRHEFVIGTTRLVVRPTDRREVITLITRIIYLFMSYLRRFTSKMEIYVLTLPVLF